MFCISETMIHKLVEIWLFAFLKKRTKPVIIREEVICIVHIPLLVVCFHFNNFKY
mgnify:CR=1 FL=1